MVVLVSADRSAPPAPTAAASKSSPLSTSALLGYLREAHSADRFALPVLGLKVCIKGGAALQAGLENVPAGPIRRLAGCYVLYACFQLDTLVDELPDFERALLVRQFVEATLTQSRSYFAICRDILFCRRLTPRERLRCLLVVHNLRGLVRSAEALLTEPERLHFFHEKLASLTWAVVEDMNLEERARDTLSRLAPDYPAMGLSGLEVLWLLQGRPLEEIHSFRPVFSLAEQLARLEDDVLEVRKARAKGGSEDEVRRRVDRRNLVLRHALHLHTSLEVAMEEGCVSAGQVEEHLGRELARLEGHPQYPVLRRVVTFFPTFVDQLIGPHRIPPPVRLAAQTQAG